MIMQIFLIADGIFKILQQRIAEGIFYVTFHCICIGVNIANLYVIIY